MGLLNSMFDQVFPFSSFSCLTAGGSEAIDHLLLFAACTFRCQEEVAFELWMSMVPIQ